MLDLDVTPPNGESEMASPTNAAATATPVYRIARGPPRV
jgi:hypothetical protein